MLELKPLSKEGIAGALARVERYRLLNEPEQAESICQDILRCDADNQEALISLLLAITDQFSGGEGPRAQQTEDSLVALRVPQERICVIDHQPIAHLPSRAIDQGAQTGFGEDPVIQRLPSA